MSSLRATVSLTGLLALSLISVVPQVFAATATGNGGTPGTCYNVSTPAPAVAAGDLTYPVCIGGAVSGPTPIAYPTNGSGVLLVAPTALPTLIVVVTNPTAFPTPIAYATGVGSVLTVPTAPPDNRNSSGGTQTINCDKSVVINISTATTTALVAVSGSTSVYVCAYDISLHSGTNPAFQFEYGSGTACATSPIALTGTFGGANASADQDFKNGSGTGVLFGSIASNGLCLVSTGTTPNLQGVVTYAQF